MTPYQSLTSQEARDELAGYLRWFAPGTNPQAPSNVEWTRNVTDRERFPLEMAGWDRATNTPHHPIPDTLDGARDAFPPGWRWKKLDGSFVAYNEDGMYVDVDDTTDEKLDRFRLACGAWRAVKGIV